MTQAIFPLSMQSPQAAVSRMSASAEIIEFPTRQSTCVSIRLIAERKAGLHDYLGSLTAKDEAQYSMFFTCLAAGYNDIMRAEYNHRRTYGCQPDWKCKCPVHQQLLSDCNNKLWRPLQQTELPVHLAKFEPLTAEWWADKGFCLVRPVANPDPMLDWVVLPDGSLPMLPELPEWAANWWANFLVNYLPGALPPDDGMDNLRLHYTYRYTPIEWTTELRIKLEAELLKGLKQQIVFRAPPEGLDPITLGCGLWGHDCFIGDACRAVGIDMPIMQAEAKMIITPGSISTHQKVLSAL